MRQIEDLVRFESAGSGVAFRERAYTRDERADLLRDVVALANAAVTGPRFLFLGVVDTPGGERRIVGLPRQDWRALKSGLKAMLGHMIEPAPTIVARSLKVDGVCVGTLCLPACADPPYLLSANAADVLPAGGGWVRRGTRVVPLLRADLERMFATKKPDVAATPPLEIGFAGDTPQTELTLPVLDLDELPSAVAAGKVRKLLEARQSTKATLGRTETRLSRLMHAQIFGVDQPYAPHSEDSLRAQIDRAVDEYRVADAHYTYEVRAHKLDFVVRNAGERALDDVVLHVKVPRVDAMGIAGHVFPSAVGVVAADGYPQVMTGKHSFEIEARIGSLAAGRTARAFRQPPRLWARAGAAGKTLPIAVTVRARELREPFNETLILRLIAAAPSR